MTDSVAVYHLAEVEQHRHQRRGVDVDLLGEVGGARRRGRANSLAVALADAPCHRSSGPPSAPNSWRQARLDFATAARGPPGRPKAPWVPPRPPGPPRAGEATGTPGAPPGPPPGPPRPGAPPRPPPGPPRPGADGRPPGPWPKAAGDLGIIAGLGRGIPPRPPPAPPSRPAGGRGGPLVRATLRGAGRGDGPPCDEPNGLLPGRGEAARAADGPRPGAFGVRTGRATRAGRQGASVSGAADSSAAGSGVDSGSGVGSAAGLRGPGFRAGRGRGLRQRPSRARRRPAPRRQPSPARLLGGRFGGAAGAALAAAAFSSSPYCFLKRISTGSSTVEEADDELAHLLELLENELALDAVLLGEFMDSGLSHVETLLLLARSQPRISRGRNYGPLVGCSECSSPEVLIECS